MKFIILLGRVLYSLIFLLAIYHHFLPDAVQYAASKSVPMPQVLVPVSGIISFVGALSIIVGFKAKWGAWMIVGFLVPVTFMMHDFWNEIEPMQKQMQTNMFMKNISMLGAALMISYFGSGPLSLDTALAKK